MAQLYGGSIAAGYVDALNQIQAREQRAQQMRAQQQQMQYQAWMMQQAQLQQRQQQLAQQNAANAYAQAIQAQQAPQVPVGAMPNGAQAPEPGQASVPAQPPAPPAMPPGMQAAPMPPGGPATPPMPPQVPLQGAAPPQAPPPPIRPYTAPGAAPNGPPPGAPQVPLQGAGAPAGAQPGVAPGAGPGQGGLSLQNVAQTLIQQGVQGQDLYQALMSAMPLMDAQSKMQMAMLSQQYKQAQLSRQEAADQERARHNLEQEKIGRERVQKMGATDAGIENAWNDEAIEQAAADMLLNGRMPPIGQSKDAAKIRGLVEQERVRQRKELGLTAAQAAALPMAGKADAASLLQMVKRTDFVEQAENAALQNGKMAAQLADKVKGLGDVRVFNQMALAGQTQFNNPDVASYLTALDAFKKEYVRVMTSPTSNAMPTEGAQARANELIGQGTSPEALKAQLKTLEQDMHNVLESSREQMQGIRNRLANPGKYYGSRSGSAASETPAAGGDGWSAKLVP